MQNKKEKQILLKIVFGYKTIKDANNQKPYKAIISTIHEISRISNRQRTIQYEGIITDKDEIIQDGCIIRGNDKSVIKDDKGYQVILCQ